MGIAIVKKALWFGKKYAPEILTYGGTICMLGGTVRACKQTPKAVEILDNTKQQLTVIKATEEEAAQNNRQVKRGEGLISYSSNDYKKDLTIAHVNNIKALAKNYAVPALMLFGGAAMVLGGHGIMRKRNAVAIATLSSVMEGFNRYRGNVIKELGETADKHFRFGKGMPDVVETVDAETGEVTQEKTSTDGFKDFPDDDPRFFMFSKETAPDFYKGNLLMDLAQLRSFQNMSTDLLRMDGNLVVNQVRKICGVKAIDNGIDNGWVIDGEGDGYVDFGIFDRVTGEPKAWVYDCVKESQGIPIELNIDGNIKGLLKRPRNAR